MSIQDSDHVSAAVAEFRILKINSSSYYDYNSLVTEVDWRHSIPLRLIYCLSVPLWWFLLSWCDFGPLIGGVLKLHILFLDLFTTDFHVFHKILMISCVFSLLGHLSISIATRKYFCCTIINVGYGIGSNQNDGMDLISFCWFNQYYFSHSFCMVFQWMFVSHVWSKFLCLVRFGQSPCLWWTLFSILCI